MGYQYLCNDMYIQADDLFSLEKKEGSTIEHLADKYDLAIYCEYNWMGNLVSFECDPFEKRSLDFFYKITPYVGDGHWIDFLVSDRERPPRREKLLYRRRTLVIQHMPFW